MVCLELTVREAELMHRILNNHLTEVRAEVAAGKIVDLDDLLTFEETALEHILDSLSKQGTGCCAELYGGYPE